MALCSHRVYREVSYARPITDQRNPPPALGREGPRRRIARHLHIGWHKLAKYLDNRAPLPSRRDRTSKLDAFKPAVVELLQEDPEALAPVLLQRLQTLGYDGGITILKDYLQAVRKDAARRRAYVRMEWNPRRAKLRNRLGILRRPDLQRNAAQVARLLLGGMSQPQDVPGVHTQSELRTFVRRHMHAF